jgi:tRNA 2-thiouridine synthesizing protein E
MSQTELSELSKQVASLSESVAYLVKRQQKQEELFEEMMPIAKLAMGATIDKLDLLERDGTMDFVRELAGIGVRVKEGFSPADVRQLGDAVVGILGAVRSLTQPEVLQVAMDAAEALESSDDVAPLGLFGMVRATKNADVQRGMAVMMEVLKRIGHGVKSMDAKADSKSARKKSLAKMLGSRRKPMGTEKRLPEHAASVAPAAPAAPRTARKVASTSTVVIDGVEFCNNGHLTNASEWTEDIARAIAAVENIELSDQHWALINAARAEFLESGKSPNIRRLTLITEMSTRDIYGLFPKAPGRTIARVAGCPKPAGCL